MKIHIRFSIVALVFSGFTGWAQQTFTSRGVGGGGALFAPTINPANHQEFYLACDMSELFHTTNAGSAYEVVHFNEIQGGHNSTVRFTSDPAVRYCIDYSNNQVIPVKSNDQGATWNPLPGNPDPWEETYFIQADYTNPDHLIIAYYGSVYFSDDGGISFSLIHTAVNNGSGVLTGGAFFESGNIYVGTNDGLLVSSNSGSTYTQLPTTGIPSGQVIYSFAGGRKNGITRFFCLTADAGDVYAGLPGSDYWGLNQGVYSMDAVSGTWIPKMTGIIPGTDFPMFVAMAADDINTVYLAGSNTSSEPEILKTTNAGSNWIQVFLTGSNQNIATGWCGNGGDRQWSYAECPFGFAVAPDDPDILLFTDYGFIHRSVNGGGTWLQSYVSIADQHAPGNNTPSGASYHSVGLENTTCWQVHWTNAYEMFSCFSDIRGCKSSDGGQTWNFSYSGHTQNTMYRLVQHPNGNLYAATSTVHDMYQSTRLQDNLLDAASADGKVIFSTDQGNTWNDMHDFSHPVFWVALDPVNSNRMYVSVINYSQGLGGIYRSDNLLSGSASTWIKLPDPPRTEGHPACILVLNDGKVVCTYSGRRNSSGAFTNSSGVFIYDPQSGAWTDVSDPGQHYWTRDIVADPGDPLQNTWYTGVFNGWGGPPNGLGGLYRTTNRGISWSRIYNGGSVNSITFRPGMYNQSFITTETNGLLYSTDMNLPNPNFQPVQAYHFRQPERVFFNPFQSNEMWVSSFGYGMQMTNLIATGFPDIQSCHEKQIIYPNPSHGTIRLKNIVSDPANASRVSVEIRKPDGQFLKKYQIGFTQLLDLSILPSGLYFIQIKNNNQIWNEKLILNY